MNDRVPLEPHAHLPLIHAVHAELGEDSVARGELLEAVGRGHDVAIADQGSAANVLQARALLELDAHDPGSVSQLLSKHRETNELFKPK